MNEKPEALRLAEWIESDPIPGDDKIASTLRRLHAENERLREVLNRFEYSSDGHIKRYPEEEEVIAALRRDAERYWWLKAKVEDYDGHACFPEVPYPAPIPDRSPFDAVDAAIDAAMKEGT